MVIANPPYINIANIKPDEYRTLLKSIFYSARNKSDLFAFFIEKSFDLLNYDGIISFIIPHTWKATDSFKNLREIIFTKHSLKQIVNLNYGVFDAIVQPLIAVFSNQYKENYAIRILNSKFEFEDIINSRDITDNSSLAIYTTISSTERGVLKKIEINSKPLSNYIEFSRGIKTSNDRRFIFDCQIDHESRKVYRGKNIKRYSLEWANEFIWYRPDLMKEKVGSVSYTRDFFEVPEKIVLQRISKGLCATIDRQQNYFLDTVILSHYKSINNETTFDYICGLLNSKILNFESTLKSRGQIIY